MDGMKTTTMMMTTMDYKFKVTERKGAADILLG